MAFIGCTDADSCTTVFMLELNRTLSQSTKIFQKLYRKTSLPTHQQIDTKKERRMG